MSEVWTGEWFTVSNATLARRAWYGGRKGARAQRRLRARRCGLRIYDATRVQLFLNGRLLCTDAELTDVTFDHCPLTEGVTYTHTTMSTMADFVLEQSAWTP